MLVCDSIEAVRANLRAVRDRGSRIGLVPTMGYLHEGHLSLVRTARELSDFVVMSSFVNPLQFGPHEDLATYPRDEARDRDLAAGAGVSLFWCPTAATMYPVSPQVTVDPGPTGSILEGAIRPGHFAGVLTVVLKLFNVVQPHVAVFGRKDAQQAALVRRMVADLNVPVEVAVAPTVRDHDLLALSSRNVYLDPAARSTARVLPEALAAGVAAFRSGERRAGQVVAAAYSALAPAERTGALTVEYVSVLDPDTFQPSHAATPTSYLAAAVRVGARRLIDNVVLGEGLDADPRLESPSLLGSGGLR